MLNFLKDNFTCPLCEHQGGVSARPDKGESAKVECPRCGRYIISADAHSAVRLWTQADKHRLIGAIREASQRQSGIHIEVLSYSLESLLATAPGPFDVSIKARKLLSALARGSMQPGDWVQIAENIDWPLAFASGAGELIFLTEYIKDQGWANKQREPAAPRMQLQLTASGWEEVQRRPRLESTQGFVAMSFKDDMTPTYTDAIEPAVRDDCGYECKRIDAKEYNGAIIDEIKAEIQQSRFVVADLTHQSKGVYYEAGFADGLGIPVVWTCRKDHAKETHFDTKHINQIQWTSHEELRTRLKNRIIGTIGRGPLAPRKTIKG